MKADPELLFSKLERIGKGSFGEVYKGYVYEFVKYSQFLFTHIASLWLVDKRNDHISGEIDS